MEGPLKHKFDTNWKQFRVVMGCNKNKYKVFAEMLRQMLKCVYNFRVYIHLAIWVVWVL